MLPAGCYRGRARWRRPARTIQTQAKHWDRQHTKGSDFQQPRQFGLATPRELVDYLNQFVIGQESAKKVLSVAVYNHYNRVRANMILEEGLREAESPSISELDPQSGVSNAQLRPLRKGSNWIKSLLDSRKPMQLFGKSNVLLLGPTGSGKTLLARTLAQVIDVPFSTSDATSFTQAGYIGEDVDMAIQRLLQAANWDPLRASMGIVYIDEIDKISRKSGGGTDGSRDVGGEGVQQALLRMMEGSTVSIQAKAGANSGDDNFPQPSTGTGEQSQERSKQKSSRYSTAPASARPETYHIDTSNILFIVSGAFVGLDNIVKQRVVKGSIGFGANLISSRSESLPFFTPNRKASKNPLDAVETQDLVKYGFIPEFVSRVPVISTLHPLSFDDLRRILTEVKGSLISQYTSLFGYSGVEIKFTSFAIDEICNLALERGGGARGLRGIMESILLDPMYEVPGSDISMVLITEDVVRGGSAQYWRRSDAVGFLNAWSKAEQKYQQSQHQTT